MHRGSVVVAIAVLAGLWTAPAALGAGAEISTDAGAYGSWDSGRISPLPQPLLSPGLEPLDLSVTMAPDRRSFTIADRHLLLAGRGCTYQVPLRSALCRAFNGELLGIGTLGSPFADRVVLRGGPSLAFWGFAGNDVVDARSADGQATLADGADRIDARGGGYMRIECGAGIDVVLADAEDVVHPDCEHVTVS